MGVAETGEQARKVVMLGGGFHGLSAAPRLKPALEDVSPIGERPAGVKLAGAIGEIARQTVKNGLRFKCPQGARIILLNRPPRVDMSFPHDLGIEVKSGATVQYVDKNGFTIESDSQTYSIAAKTVIWAGGFRVSPLRKVHATRTMADGGRGRIEVKPDLTIPNYPESTSLEISLQLPTPMAGSRRIGPGCDAGRTLWGKFDVKKAPGPAGAFSVS